MNAFWDHFEDVLRRTVPTVFEGLRPPASEAAVAAAEAELELEFPDDLRQAYLRHDGGHQPRWMRRGEIRLSSPFVNFRWCPLEEVRERWRYSKGYFAANQSLNQEWLDALDDLDVSESEVLLDMWDPHRIPVGRNLTSSVLSVDLKPGGAGVVGQLIEECMDWEPFVVAPGIGAYFERLAELLESGVLAHDPQKGFLQAGSRDTTLFRIFPTIEWWDQSVSNG